MISTQRLEVYFLPILENSTSPRHVKTDLGKEYWGTRRKRQQVDVMLQSMENRVKMLKNEEEKLWKKIAKNQNQANIVLNVKDQNRKFNLQKMQNRQGLALSQQYLQAQHGEKRILQTQLKEDISTASFNQHHNQYYSIKLDSLQNERQIIAVKNDVTINNQLLGSTAKGNRVQAVIRNQSRLNQLSDGYRDDYRKKISVEEMLQDQRQNRINDLESIEFKLMDRLKNTQTLNLDVEGQLRDIKGTKSTDILTKLSDMNILNQFIKKSKMLSRHKRFLIIKYDSIGRQIRDDSVYQTANDEVSMVIKRKKRKIKNKLKSSS